MSSHADRRPSSPPVPHRRLGEQLDLFHIPDDSPGMAAWHPRGLVLYRALEDLVRELHARFGYQEVRSPLVCASALWERSGHAAKFADKMFGLDVDGLDAALKPMNCPGHAELFAHRPRSYRELPLRLAELGHVHRAEQSGEINGLLRARSFVIDDAHVFCRPGQEAEELRGCLRMAREVYDLFGLVPHAELSLRPEQRLGSDALWDRAEGALRDALVAAGLRFEERPGEGAFYGPKIDLHVEDGHARSWQLGSVQLDYQLPGRFGLEYVNEAGVPEEPVIVHRALLGSFERFIAIVLEHLDGVLPVWLAPEAVRVLPVGAAQAAYAESIARGLREAGVRAHVDADGPLGGRIRAAHAARVPLVAVAGEREAGASEVAVRRRGERAQSPVAVDAFAARLAEAVARRELAY
jgi:threonyl-tRNA synthetase